MRPIVATGCGSALAGGSRREGRRRHRAIVTAPQDRRLTITGLKVTPIALARPAVAGRQRLPRAVFPAQRRRIADRGRDRRHRRDPRRRGRHDRAPSEATELIDRPERLRLPEVRPRVASGWAWPLTRGSRWPASTPAAARPAAASARWSAGRCATRSSSPRICSTGTPPIIR